MPLVTAAQLERFRGAVESIMFSTATILRKQIVSDGAGGQTDTYVSVGTSECYFAQPQVTPVEREVAPGIRAQAPWRFAFPSGTTILPTDRLVVGSRTFEVVYGGANTLDLYLTVFAMEII